MQPTPPIRVFIRPRVFPTERFPTRGSFALLLLALARAYMYIHNAESTIWMAMNHSSVLSLSRVQRVGSYLSSLSLAIFIFRESCYTRAVPRVLCELMFFRLCIICPFRGFREAERRALLCVWYSVAGFLTGALCAECRVDMLYLKRRRRGLEFLRRRKRVEIN